VPRPESRRVSFDDVRGEVNRYYTGKLAAFGPVPRGVDWNSEESQRLRFAQLTRVIDAAPGERFSLLDFGCGYGALAGFLAERWEAAYTGYDLSPAMLEAARAAYPAARFTADAGALAPVDYVVASGVFSVKLETPVPRWEAYVRDTLGTLAAHATRGFAFNLLTAYSDADRMRPDLYYADPHLWFDYCRTTFSRRVALLHDYPLYEFTLIVRP
jgi:SAM-dependent methyltransferase